MTRSFGLLRISEPTPKRHTHTRRGDDKNGSTAPEEEGQSPQDVRQVREAHAAAHPRDRSCASEAAKVGSAAVARSQEKGRKGRKAAANEQGVDVDEMRLK